MIYLVILYFDVDLTVKKSCHIDNLLAKASVFLKEEQELEMQVKQQRCKILELESQLNRNYRHQLLIKSR